MDCAAGGEGLGCPFWIHECAPARRRARPRAPRRHLRPGRRAMFGVVPRVVCGADHPPDDEPDHPGPERRPGRDGGPPRAGGHGHGRQVERERARDVPDRPLHDAAGRAAARAGWARRTSTSWSTRTSTSTTRGATPATTTAGPCRPSPGRATSSRWGEWEDATTSPRAQPRVLPRGELRAAGGSGQLETVAGRGRGGARRAGGARGRAHRLPPDGGGRGRGRDLGRPHRPAAHHQPPAAAVPDGLRPVPGGYPGGQAAPAGARRRTSAGGCSSTTTRARRWPRVRARPAGVTSSKEVTTA